MNKTIIIIRAKDLFFNNRFFRFVFCNHDQLRMIKYSPTSKLPKSANAFWQRNKKKLTGKKQQRNNSTVSETRSSHLKTFKKSITQKFKRKKKRITARSVIRKRTNTITTDDPFIEMQLSPDQPLSTQDESQHSDQFVSQGNSDESNEDHTLQSTISSSRLEQQNINATDNTSRSIRAKSQSTINDANSSRKTKRSNSKFLVRLEYL